MPKQLLFDSNIIIYYLNNTLEVEPYFENIKIGAIEPVISIISRIEILSFPSITEQEINIVGDVLDNFQIVGLTNNIVKHAILLKRNHNIKIPDAIIASTALEESIPLVTRDKDGFKNIDELVIENPFKL